MHAEEPHLPDLASQVAPGTLSRLEPLLDVGHDAPVDPAADGVADVPLLVGEQVVDAERIPRFEGGLASLGHTLTIAEPGFSSSTCGLFRCTKVPCSAAANPSVKPSRGARRCRPDPSRPARSRYLLPWALPSRPMFPRPPRSRSACPAPRRSTGARHGRPSMTTSPHIRLRGSTTPET